MIDRDDRLIARFPPHNEDTVRSAMEHVLDQWRIGRGDLAVSGGARGADILFAELCLERGAWVRLLVPLPDEQFIARSVRLPGTNWEQRYLRLRERCETWHWRERAFTGSHSETEMGMERTNRWILDTCRAEAAPERFFVLLVWDGQDGGDGPGGTADFAALALRCVAHVVTLNPMLAGEEGERPE